MLSARGLSSGDVYQAIGCSRQKLGQDVSPEDKGVGSVYTWKVYMEIPKARKSVCEKSSKLRIGLRRNPQRRD